MAKKVELTMRERQLRDFVQKLIDTNKNKHGRTVTNENIREMIETSVRSPDKDTLEMKKRVYKDLTGKAWPRAKKKVEEPVDDEPEDEPYEEE